MAFREFIMVLKCKNYLEKRSRRILLHILSPSLGLPRRGRLAINYHRGRQLALWFFHLFLFSFGLRGEEIGKPRSTFGKFLSICLTIVLEITLWVLRKLWNVFKFCRETQKAWRHDRVYILSSKHTYRPMRARVLSQIFYNKSCSIT